MQSGGRSVPAASGDSPDAVAHSSDTGPSSPSKVTSYRKVEVIAKGGMGRVELAARQEGRFRRLYAIKRLHDHLLDEEGEFEQMFLDEARVAGLVDHPNVVGVLDVGRDAEGPYLVMPYVHGLPLSRLVSLARKAGVQLPVEVVVRIGLDVARGLHAAHEVRDETGAPLGLVHRDVSPQNVLVGFDGAARVTDFGIAKAIGQSTRTSTGVAKGKHAYMSPEQIRLETLDRRSDLFALGVVLFEALAGRRLYSGAASDGPLRILEEAPPDIGEHRADVPPELVELLLELLAKHRDERPADAGVVGERLEQILAALIASGARQTVPGLLEQIASDDRAMLEERQRRALAAPLSTASVAPIVTSPAMTQPIASAERGLAARWGALAAAVAVVVIGASAWWLTRGSEPTVRDTHEGAPADPTPPSAPDDPASPPIEAVTAAPPAEPTGAGPDEHPSPATAETTPRARPRRPPRSEASPPTRPAGGGSTRVGWEGEDL